MPVDKARPHHQQRRPHRICEPTAAGPIRGLPEPAASLNISVPCTGTARGCFRDVLPDRVVIHAENYGERYAPIGQRLGSPSAARSSHWRSWGVLTTSPSRQYLHSAPVGASTSTSASVSVALVGRSTA